MDNTETQDAYELMMHEIFFLKEKHAVPEVYETNTGGENIWYLDNGASNHMTGDKRYFSMINTLITGKVRFGDDSCIDIKGKGTISFIDMNGESRKMTDMYYILDLKSNIISLGQATKNGCDIQVRGEQLTMHDKNRKLLTTASRSRNRLYKVRMGLNPDTSQHLTGSIEPSRWHARLGHVNLEMMRAMIQRELVLGIPSINIEKEVCGSCVKGKQTRQVFPQATQYRASRSFSLYTEICAVK